MRLLPPKTESLGALIRVLFVGVPTFLMIGLGELLLGLSTVATFAIAFAYLLIGGALLLRLYPKPKEDMLDAAEQPPTD